MQLTSPSKQQQGVEVQPLPPFRLACSQRDLSFRLLLDTCRVVPWLQNSLDFYSQLFAVLEVFLTCCPIQHLTGSSQNRHNSSLLAGKETEAQRAELACPGHLTGGCLCCSVLASVTKIFEPISLREEGFALAQSVGDFRP